MRFIQGRLRKMWQSLRFSISAAALVAVSVGANASGVSGVPAKISLQSLKMVDPAAAQPFWYRWDIDAVTGELRLFNQQGFGEQTWAAWAPSGVMTQYGDIAIAGRADAGSGFCITGDSCGTGWMMGAGAGYWQLSKQGIGTQFRVNENTVDVMDNSLVSSKACATGYSRIAPNYCQGFSGIYNTWSLVPLVRDACTSVAVPGDARAVVFYLRASAFSAAATSGTPRSAVIEEHQTSACTGVIHTLAKADAYEFSAVAASVLATDVSETIIRPQAGPGGSVYLKFSDDAGNNGSASYGIVGYYD